MNVTREVILDLIPLVIAGEASPATSALVEEYLKQDPELAERARLMRAEGLAPIAPADVPPDLELKSLRRTRRLLALQRWLFGLGIAFTATSFSMRMDFQHGRITDFRFFLGEYPLAYGIMLGVGLVLLIAYFALRRRLRASSR